MNASLRPATSEDLQRIVEVEKSVHSAPWTVEHFQAELEKPHSRFLVLTDDDTDEKILGYAVYWVMDGEVQILNIAVPLEHRGLGYAQWMMNSILTDAIQRSTSRVLLDVRKSNQAAIGLYQKFQFSIARIHKRFYSNGEDSYQMVLDLLGSNPKE